MGKEAHWARARGTFFAKGCAVASRVQPAFKDAMGKGAGIASAAHPLAELRARQGLVRAQARVPAASLLSRVEVRALTPVVDAVYVRAGIDLQRK